MPTNYFVCRSARNASQPHKSHVDLGGFWEYLVKSDMETFAGGAVRLCLRYSGVPGTPAGRSSTVGATTPRMACGGGQAGLPGQHGLGVDLARCWLGFRTKSPVLVPCARYRAVITHRNCSHHGHRMSRQLLMGPWAALAGLGGAGNMSSAVGESRLRVHHLVNGGASWNKIFIGSSFFPFF